MSQAARRIYTDRSRAIDSQRCKRLRYLGYHAGSQHRGLQPVRKSIHLVIGGAVHAGLEHLLKYTQKYWTEHPTMTLEEVFVAESSVFGRVIRFIEDQAVEAALVELAAMTKLGVELDMNEQAGTQLAVDAASGVKIDFSDTRYVVESNVSAVVASDSPIMIDFSDCSTASQQLTTFGEQLDASVKLERESAGEVVDWSKPIYEKNPSK